MYNSSFGTGVHCGCLILANICTTKIGEFSEVQVHRFERERANEGWVSENWLDSKVAAIQLILQYMSKIDLRKAEYSMWNMPVWQCNKQDSVRRVTNQVNYKHIPKCRRNIYGLYISV